MAMLVYQRVPDLIIRVPQISCWEAARRHCVFFHNAPTRVSEAMDLLMIGLHPR